jgi:hypothetical protein
MLPVSLSQPICRVYTEAKPQTSRISKVQRTNEVFHKSYFQRELKVEPPYFFIREHQLSSKTIFKA